MLTYIAVEDTNEQNCEDETDTEVDYDGLVDTESCVAKVMDQIHKDTDIDIVLTLSPLILRKSSKFLSS